VTGEEFLDLVRTTIPSSEVLDVEVERLAAGQVRLRMKATARHTRAGGTLSGPTLMTLADRRAICRLSVLGGQAESFP
jgi:acyl-coenzyme A thioesterase PaaI-like protein